MSTTPKRPVRLRTLIIRASALSGLVALATAVIGLGIGLNGAGAVLVQEAVETMARGVPGQLCREDPARWQWPTPEGGVVGFFDQKTAAKEPGMAPEVLAMLAAGETSFLGRVRGGGRAFAVALGTGGPCSLYYHRWQPKRAVLRLFALVVPVVLAIVGMLAALLGTWLIVRPLRKRLRALEQAAAQVGVDGAVTNAGAGDVVELAAVGQALDVAHHRILADRAQQAARQRALEDHLAALAHDTNTPLTSLFMALESLEHLESHRETRGDSGAVDARSLVDSALGDVVYLASLIQNLALDRRFVHGDAVPADHATRFDLRGVVDRVTRRGARLGRPRGVSVDGAWPDAELWVRGQPVLVEQALMNLVQNAVDHGFSYTLPPPDADGQGGQVLVVLEDLGDRFALWVSDDGPGVSSKEVGRLTERGYRAAASKGRRPAGSGLGLSTAQAVCAAHGWQLELTGRGPHGGLHLAIRGPIWREALA